MEQQRLYGVSAREKEPLLRFILDALEQQGYTIVHASQPKLAPFRVILETALGERMGIIPYTLAYREAGELIEIGAVAHQNRRPDYWSRRP